MGSGKRGCESMREKTVEEGRSDRRSHRKIQLLLFALPLLGASFIQQLYNTVDLFFVGNLLGTDATAAVGASSLLTSCIVGFFHRAVCGDRRSRLAGGRREKRGEDPEDHSHCRGAFPCSAAFC